MAPLDLSVTRTARFETGVFDAGGTEVVVFDGGRFYATNANANAIDIYTQADGKVGSISLAGVTGGGGVTSVAAKDGVIAAAIANVVPSAPGFVALFDANDTSAPVAILTVGVLPDMLTFTPDGTRIAVALEGQPEDDGSFDAPGGIAVIEVDRADLGASTVQVFDFTAFDNLEEQLRAEGVRIREGVAASVDFEPEYIAVDPQTGNLFVTLQENNAVAVFDMQSMTFTDIQALGFVDHSVTGIDPSDRDGGPNIRTVPVLGMRMPDAIATFVVDGKTYYATANEGDSRDYAFYSDEARLKNLALDPTVFPDAAVLQQDAQLGRLTVSRVDGDLDGDGDLDEIYAFGGRSFSIFDEDGNLVFDSGDDFERIILEQAPSRFNVGNDEPFAVDNRSDNKGPEPEAIAIAEVGGRLIAVIALERANGLMLYDVTDPGDVSFLKYVDTVVDVPQPADVAGLLQSDLGPETIAVIRAEDSDSGLTEIAVANEISGSVSVYALDFTPPAPTFDLQITEIWPGNPDGSNLTADWFEVTNFGKAAWTAADGALFYDDESTAPADAVSLSGVTSIAPGESVVFVGGDTAQFRTVWAGIVDADTQVGAFSGAGLGQGGDAVALFLDAEGDGVQADDLIDREAYPNADASLGASWEVTPGGFADDGIRGAGTTSVVNNVGQPAVGSPGFEASTRFTLEILHVTDQEAGAAAVFDAPRLSAVLNALEAQDLGNDGIADNTLRLSSGDAILPGLFFQSSAAVFGVAGVADILIQNELGFDAIAFGNHEFDFGSGFIADLIDGTFDLDNDPATPETALSYSLPGVPAFTGTAFPYLSANLDFSTEPSLAPLEVAGGAAPIAGTVTSSVVLEQGGELIGIVGATTPTIDFISSPGLLGVAPADFDGSPTPEQLDALAAIIQAEVDAMLHANPGLNKVILLAHMQQIDIELGLAARLTDVDVIVAGGSNTRLLDATDRLREGDTAQGQYPLVVQNAGGTDTLVVNTDGSYKYVGRLVIDFDLHGNIIADSYDPTVSGAYATDAQGVADLGAEALVDPEVQAIVDLIGADIASKEGNIFGASSVYLAGLRPEIRQQETNLGNLTAEANLAEARKADGTVLVSIKNGGGIRDDIGQIVVPAGGTEPVRIPNEAILDADGNVIKPAGGISETDIVNALRFNNDLALVTLTGAELRAVLEHGVAASTYDADGGANQQGRFPQIAGVKFSFDPVLTPGARIVNAAVLDENGDVVVELVRDGETVSPETLIRVVTLGFLADGGDGYPFPTGDGAQRVNLEQEGVRTGAATFADDGTEQDALAEYLSANFVDTPYAQADTDIAGDERIQNLAFREDGVFEPETPAGAVLITEIVEGSGINKAVEITNGTDEEIDLGAEGYALKFFFNGAVTAGATIALNGTLAPGATWVVADDGASAAILALADQTSTANFFNGDDAIVLYRGDEVVDSFGRVGEDPGSEWSGGGADDTLRRKPEVTQGDTDPTDAFVTTDEWDVFGRDDISDLGVAPVTQPLVINEVLVSHTGTDNTEYFEIYGAPGASLAGLSFVAVRASTGVYTFVYNFADDDVLGDNGFFLVGNPEGLAVNYGVTPDADLATNALQNNASTFALVQTASLGGGVGTGPTGSEVVLDAVASTDVTGGTFFFDAPVIGPDGAFLPAGVRRAEDGVDTDAAADWVIADFNLGAANTPTAGGAGDGGVGGGGGSIDDAPTLISVIQGVADLNARNGQTLVVEGIVTGDFQNGDADAFRNLGGFFLMEELADRDGDALTSEGIFIDDAALALLDVAEGDKVRVLGTVQERFGKTIMVATEVRVEQAGAVTDLNAFAEVVTLPGLAGREALESMLVAFDEPLTFVESFDYEQFGEMTLASGGEVVNFTQTNLPDAAGYAAHLADKADRTILLDDGTDGRRASDSPILQPDGEPFAVNQGIRMGQELAPVTAIMDFGFNAWRLRLPEFETFETVESTNPRPAEPVDVGGSLKVAAFNVLNFFTTLNSRGAESPEELARQTEKLIAGFLGIDADVLALIEIENNGTAIAELTAEINAAFDDREYAFVQVGDTGVVGSDAITVGFIYDTLTVELVGDAAVLDAPSFVAPLTPGDDQNRPAVAQTFREKATEGEFTAVANHFKSKGSLTGNAADQDQGDGAGANNATRAEAARQLAEWLATDPTGSGDDDVLILGDLNAYAREEPIRILEDAGYVNTVAAFEGLEQNSYRFSGEIGTLDYALANGSLNAQVTGATSWNINGDEMFIFDYNLNSTFGTPLGRPQDQGLFDGANPAKSSDHDPIIVGLRLDSDAPALNLVQGGAGNDRLTGTDAADLIVAGAGNNVVAGGLGADVFRFGDELANGRRETTQIRDYEALSDIIDLGGADYTFRETGAGVILTAGADRDAIIVRGVSTIDQILFADDLIA